MESCPLCAKAQPLWQNAAQPFAHQQTLWYLAAQCELQVSRSMAAHRVVSTVMMRASSVADIVPLEDASGR